MKKREKSAILQFLSNLYTVFISSFMPFIIRTLLVRYIGIEYVGVSSLFSSVLQVLNVVDFGLTTSLTFYLYKPVEEDDRESINTYMGFLRRVFHIVGVTIAAFGIAVIPFLNKMVKGQEYPYGLNIYLVYLVYIIQISVPYLTNTYMYPLLSAYLKSHINSLIIGSCLLIMYVIQIIVIVVFKNYYIYIFALLIACILQTISYLYVKHKCFPWINFEGNLSVFFIKEFKEKAISMILSKLRNVSRNSFDSIIVSYFFGLVILAKYQNYYQIIIVPLMITQMIRLAVQPSLGNGIAVETIDSNYGIIKQYMLINSYVTLICVSCLLSMIQPFMTLWMGTENLLGMNIVICVTVYYYTLSLAECCIMLRETTGIWREGRWVSIIEAISNLVLNIVFARIFGLVGIVVATIITVAMINIPLESYFVFRGYFKGKYKDYITHIIIYTFETAFVAGITYGLCLLIDFKGAESLFFKLIISVIAPTIGFLLIHRRDTELMVLKTTIIRMCMEYKSRIKRI